CLQYNSSPYSF
nr:immunoglobulin light chain junction region [Macaca mulatta]MOV61421.1 immunoglobulin light chain junction region [Macaca mulatta]MOV61422.1 immunoglobulin light chain junction region [Macaca mulatta]MOV61648.1 immunoglobulin light chain junction region [Macaca mulatta]MOV61691.1 immunoglobulin light chain junction region [Macaca mulatta]